MTLNRWQRIGVVLSVVWALGAGIYSRSSDVNDAMAIAGLSYQICTEAEASRSNFNFDDCSKKMSESTALLLSGSWGNAAFIALVPIPFWWGFVYFLLRVYRWVKEGTK